MSKCEFKKNCHYSCSACEYTFKYCQHRGVSQQLQTANERIIELEKQNVFFSHSAANAKEENKKIWESINLAKAGVKKGETDA